VEEDNIRDISIALGAVAPTVLKPRKIEDLLRNARIDDMELWKRASELVRRDIRPANDIRGSTWFRRILSNHLFLNAYHEINKKYTFLISQQS
jgi:CO/xanthine dehydrogenase FAD-binding subunit